MKEYKETPDLPASVKKLPQAVQKVYSEAYCHVYKGKGTEAKSHAIAWGVVKKRLNHSKGKYMALSSAFAPVEYYTFNLCAPENQLIINATGDEITFEGILASTDSFQQDATTIRKFSEEALKDLAEQINTHGSSHPDVDHETMKNLVKQYGNNYDMIMNSLPKNKGFIKSIQAVYENGKLWIKGILDSSYRKMMKVVRGMSIEAISQDVDVQSSTINKAKYLGFTFAVKSNPKIPSARVTAVSV
jgi:cation transport regulator ChaB